MKKLNCEININLSVINTLSFLPVLKALRKNSEVSDFSGSNRIINGLSCVSCFLSLRYDYINVCMYYVTKCYYESWMKCFMLHIKAVDYGFHNCINIFPLVKMTWQKGSRKKRVISCSVVITAIWKGRRENSRKDWKKGKRVVWFCCCCCFWWWNDRRVSSGNVIRKIEKRENLWRVDYFFHFHFTTSFVLLSCTHSAWEHTTRQQGWQEFIIVSCDEESFFWFLLFYIFVEAERKMESNCHQKLPRRN